MSQDDIRYFVEPTVEAKEPGRYVSVAKLVPVLELATGITSRPLVGHNLLASFVRYEPNSVAPLHAHEEEQIFVVLEGEIDLQIGREHRLMRPGDAALIPAWVLHSARSQGASAYQLDIFSPPRKAMLDMIASRSPKS